MNKLLSFAAVSALSVLSVTPALAEKGATPVPADSRIRTVTYAERDVVRLNGHYGFTTSIEFAPNETIETVSIGDSAAWQVVKPAQPNLLFVKPIEPNADTNMTVVTDKRLYTFVLYAAQAQSHRSPGLTFHVKFNYPNDASETIAYQASAADLLAAQPVAGLANASTTPEDFNFDYTYAGTERLRPLRAFDDGKFTYFSFPAVETTPAVFLVNPDGTEQIVNFQQKGQYLVVERIARQFTLRDGEAATCIFNMAFPTIQYDGAAPVRLTKENAGTERIARVAD